jgi:hypothetical protein
VAQQHIPVPGILPVQVTAHLAVQSSQSSITPASHLISILWLQALQQQAQLVVQRQGRV